MLDIESPPAAASSRTSRSAQEKKLRKRKDLDALIVKTGARRGARGASQQLLPRMSGDSSSDEGRDDGDRAGWRGEERRSLVWGVKWGIIIGGFLSLLVIIIWLHLNLRIELDQVRRHVNRGTRSKSFFTYHSSLSDIVLFRLFSVCLDCKFDISAAT